MVRRVVFLRHGESVWNADNIFTGWADIDLSTRGESEAEEAGAILLQKGFALDVVFTSVLRRAIKTVWKVCIASENYSMPVVNTFRLNERHYGALQGMNKAETAVTHGDEQVKIWRRSWDEAPPKVERSDPRHPANDAMYAGISANLLPDAESLEQTFQRVLPYWDEHIAPCISAGKTVLVVAHGNSLRALCKHIENMSEADVLEFSIPTAVPLVYELDDDDMHFVRKYYLMDEADVLKKIEAMTDQGKASSIGAFGGAPLASAAVAAVASNSDVAGGAAAIVNSRAASAHASQDGLSTPGFGKLPASAQSRRSNESLPPPSRGSAVTALGRVVDRILQQPPLHTLVGAPLADLSDCSDDEAVRSLSVAFLQAIGGKGDAVGFLEAGRISRFSELAAFYADGLARVRIEIAAAARADPGLVVALNAAVSADIGGSIKGAEPFWKVFFQAGVGMIDNQERVVADLRSKRSVKVEEMNPHPIMDPITELLFTSNILLGLPSTSKPISSLPYSDDFKMKLQATSEESQIAWFDHPIRIGVAPDANEVLYGLKGLDAAVAWEKEKGSVPADARMLAALSVTCTHTGLQALAKQYIDEEFQAMPDQGKIKHLKVMLFSEIETNAIVDRVLAPAAAKISVSDIEPIRRIFGVEGQSGRHYAFLKAVLAVYHTLVNPAVRGTFKIDLDQLFIQDSLMNETGASMLEHFKTPLWGAKGKDWRGGDVELGMIAGALCNQKDWEESGQKLFVPDVRPPPADKVLTADELICCSSLPQALSAEAEMTEQSVSAQDAIQRIHVTGGTNGILVDHLFRMRPFAPSWMRRAEDASYIYSTFSKEGPKLAYVHKPGLVMRHDEEAFASEDVEVARISKMVGECERTLLLSEYLRVCSKNWSEAKELVDPFVGCFCTPIKFTTTYLHFALKVLSLLATDKTRDAVDFATSGAPRVAKCGAFVEREGEGVSELEQTHQAEVAAWDQFYDALLAARGDAELEAAARGIFEDATCAL